MNEHVKKFIEDHIDMIDIQQWDWVWAAAFTELNKHLSLKKSLPLQLFDVLEQIVDDPLPLKWGYIEQQLKDRIYHESIDPQNRYSSNVWSTFEYMYEALDTFDIDFKEFEDHLLKNKNRLNLDIKYFDLRPEGFEDVYGYELGYLNLDKFRAELESEDDNWS